MPTLLDSAIFGPSFTDEHINALFTDEAYVRALVEVEIALARAEARLGVIPAGAAEEIGRIEPTAIKLATLAAGTSRSGFPIIALIHELRAQLSADAAPYVHWGATTQDIMDTACVLQLRVAIDILTSRLREIARGLSELADRHRRTIVAARTHSQQALPMTFGLKAAAWLAPLTRHSQRLKEMAGRLLVVQFGGAAGTLAALGDKGLAVMRAIAGELKLGTPEMPWHAQRDSFVEFAGWLSLVTGSVGKMAQDVILMAQTEVGELSESGEAGRGGSSTMPQKSNPISSEIIIAAARMNAGLVATLHNAQIQEHERATHGWQLEWLALPQMIILTGGALKHASEMALSLRVDVQTMQRNIARANDIVLAEAAVFRLSAVIGREAAETLVKRACAHAIAENRPLIEIVRLLGGESIGAGVIDWDALARPENYLGETAKIIDQILERAAKLAREEGSC
jgi:3-carboxy-cis,cis-muconate cycloisomerase